MLKKAWYYNIPDISGEGNWVGIKTYDWEILRDHEHAAEKAANQEDSYSGDYIIIKNEGIDRLLVKNEEGEIKEFKIIAEMVAVYDATEIEGTVVKP